MRALVLVAIVGCYSPTATVGLPCATNGACPSGQVCEPGSNRCVAPGPPPDDARAIDAAIGDATAVDAGADAPTQNLSGCSDGQREGLADLVKFPRIAGCAATWSGMPSMRAASTGVACGDDLGACAVPASACATGWHVCGASGAISELTALSVDDCHAAAPTGRFLAAMSHCANNVDTCVYGSTLPCYDTGWCSEPVCCGQGCSQGAGCADGVWPAGTQISADDSNGCGGLPSAADLGVLCCRN